MLLRLSKLIPVHMTSMHRIAIQTDDGSIQGWRAERATWWQWRGRIFRHRRTPI